MKELGPIQQSKGGRFMPVMVLAVALGILATTIYIGSGYLRRHFRQEMVNHDGQILDAVAQAQQFSNGAETDLGTRLQSSAEQLALALSISQIKEGVLAVRIYGSDGLFVTAFPPYVSEAVLSRATFAELEGLRPVSRYFPDTRLSDLFMVPGMAGGSASGIPFLEVNIPIRARGRKQLLAAAQLILDARNLEGEFAKLDQNLWLQACAAFLVGGSLLCGALVWAYQRLQKANALLHERTTRLLRANHELTLAAKTSAVGAVTAHLIHGLSNPLANLQNFVSDQGHNGGSGEGWRGVRAATQHMQKLVQNVVRVLGEENGSDHYEITLTELADILSAKVQPLAQDAGVLWNICIQAEGQLSNRHGNLILLILENLIHNALQVTAPGRLVQVSFTGANGDVVCHVADQGPGFPAHLLKNLFAPCRSTKGGSGLGLAISRQLAHQLGADLELARNSADGCTFVLKLPRALVARQATEAIAGVAPN